MIGDTLFGIQTIYCVYMWVILSFNSNRLNFFFLIFLCIFLLKKKIYPLLLTHDD